MKSDESDNISEFGSGTMGGRHRGIYKSQGLEYAREGLSSASPCLSFSFVNGI